MIIIPNNFKWSVSDKLSIIDSSENNITVQGGYGNHTITLETYNSFGCYSTYSNSLFINSFGSLYIPNAFAPMNPANKVNSFKPIGTGLKSYEITIFDAWGNIIWYSNKLSESGSPMESWNGSYNGKLLQSGVYTWKINAVFNNGTLWKGIQKKSGKYSNMGTILLIR
ncbi:MAG: gliding motility-associated C-terminal domain-containing protein [Bacteroidales bacterium]|jgi:hypothetical protein|nr:gliding motility-associated C-terminal domain-containing protein [Bacteroidales bacterium]